MLGEFRVSSASACERVSETENVGAEGRVCESASTSANAHRGCVQCEQCKRMGTFSESLEPATWRASGLDWLYSTFDPS